MLPNLVTQGLHNKTGFTFVQPRAVDQHAGSAIDRNEPLITVHFKFDLHGTYWVSLLNRASMSVDTYNFQGPSVLMLLPHRRC